MALATTLWPLKKIVWAVWFGDPWNSFVAVAPKHKKVDEEFTTYVDTKDYIEATFSVKEINRNNIYPKPKRRIGWNELTTEEV